MRQLPMSPPKVLEGLWAQQSNGHNHNGRQSNSHMNHDGSLHEPVGAEHT
jgi:hypothetical protein